MKTFNQKMLSGVGYMLLFSLTPGLLVAETSVNSEELEEVVVKGIRKSIEQAQDIKRNADSVVDAISSEDLGKFSDQAISDAMQRIPGVQLERNDGGQEGDRVSIRGLGPTYVNTTINGRTALSSGTEALSNLRAFNLEVIPTNIISGVVVKKTPTASDLESGLAGLVEIQTLKPLDAPAFSSSDRNYFVTTTLQGDHGSIGDDLGYRADGILGLKNDADTLGAYFSVLKGKSHPGRDQLFPTVTQRDINIDNTGDGIADEVRADVYTIADIDFEPIREDRERESFAGALQWQPNDDLSIVFDAIYTTYDNASIRNRIAPSMGGALDTSVFDASLITIDDTNTLQAVRPGGFSAGASDITVLYIPFLFGNRTESLVSGLNIDAQVTDRLKVKGDFHYGTVDYRQDLDLPILLQDIPASQVSFNSDNGLYSADLGNVPVAGYNLFQGLSLARDVFMEGKDYGFKFDFELDLDHGILQSLEYGVRWDRADVTSVRTNIIDVADNLTQAELDAIALAGSDQNNLSDFNFYPDDDVFGEFPIGNLDTFCDGIPRLCTESDLGRDPASSFAYVEDVLAFYGEANLEGDMAGKSFKANLGLRAVNVRNTGEGERVNPDSSITPLTSDNSYWELLPSANLSLDLSDDLVWRVAVGKVLSRPNPSDLVPREGANQPSSPSDIPSGRRGNPGLKPTTSWNFDTTLEYYTSQGGAVVLSFFYKDVSDFVFPITTVETLPGQGAQLFDVRTPQNFSDGEVKGFEVGFNQSFSFLPSPFDGLGMQANYTYVDTSFNEDVGDNGFGFPGSSQNNFNAILYYEKYGLGIRASYVFRDDYFRNLPGQGAQQENATALWTEGNDILTISASYEINDNFSVFVDASNLLEEGRRDFFLQEETFNGSFNRERTVTFGVTAAF
jgi:iron complex outermembrane recepter protein